MQYERVVGLKGDKNQYAISDQIKEYTLLDLGFEKTKRGNFKYEGSLDRHNPFRLTRI